MPRLVRWTRLAVGLVLFACATRTMADPDLWGHLRFGLDTWFTHTVSAIDPYSFTQDRPWVNHEWLSELQTAVAYRMAGVAGLSVLKGALVFSALWMVWNALGGADFIARIISLGLVVLGTGSITSTLRPQLWSLLSMAILCLILRRGGRWRIALPALFALWANVHGGWVVGFGVLGAWAAADVLSDRRGTVGWLLTGIASALGTLCTPYGLSLWRFLMDTVHVTRDISEWQPLFAVPTMNWLPIVATFLAACWLIRSIERQRWPTAAALIVLAYGTWRVSRIGPLFAVAAAMLLGPTIARRWPQRPVPMGSLQPRAALVATSVVVAAGLGASVWIAASSVSCIVVTGSWTPPADAVRMLTSAPTAGRVVTFFDWGQYALWHLGPRMRVSMDGRRETVYSDARLTEHDAILKGDPGGLQALSDWHAEYVWLPARSVTTKTWLSGHGYRIDLDTRDAFLAVRDDIPRWTVPLDAPVGKRCFPK